MAGERQTGPDTETRAFGFTREQFAVVARWMARAEEAEAEVARLRVVVAEIVARLRRAAAAEYGMGQHHVADGCTIAADLIEREFGCDAENGETA